MTAQKRKALEDEKEDREKDKKKAKNEKWKEIKQSKNEEQVKKMESWQKFGVKAKKKGIAPKGLLGGSMFRSPDTVNGKGEFMLNCSWVYWREGGRERMRKEGGRRRPTNERS